MGKVSRIVIHHVGTAGTQNTNTAAKVKRFHMAPKGKHKNGKYTGMGMLDIGYHKFIRGNGLLEDGCTESRIGAHVYKGNTGALGVCLSGHFGIDKPSDAQLKTLVTLLVKWCRKHKLTTKSIYGHHDTPKGRRKASCPGKNMVSKFEWLRTKVGAELYPGKYPLAKKIKDPAIRRLLDRMIGDDKALIEDEIREIIFAVVADGKATPQEIQDLKSIRDKSVTLKRKGNRGKILLNKFLSNPKDWIEKYKKKAARKADRAFFDRHPKRNGKPIRAHEKKLWKEWTALYKSFGGM